MNTQATVKAEYRQNNDALILKQFKAKTDNLTGPTPAAATARRCACALGLCLPFAATAWRGRAALP